MYVITIQLTETQRQWIISNLQFSIDSQSECQEDATDRESLDACKYLLEQIEDNAREY